MPLSRPDLRLRGESGFTLIELLGVGLIITVLALISIQVYDEIHDRMRFAKSREELRVIESALEQYRAEQGHYPDRLGNLVKEGYLKSDTTFVTPWGTKRSRPYYFYAVDDSKSGRSLAYALGDPGPSCLAALELHADAGKPLPCGKNPNQPAYSFSTEQPSLLLIGSEPETVRGHASLRTFRTSCRPGHRPALQMGVGCDLKTES